MENLKLAIDVAKAELEMALRAAKTRQEAEMVLAMAGRIMDQEMRSFATIVLSRLTVEELKAPPRVTRAA